MSQSSTEIPTRLSPPSQAAAGVANPIGRDTVNTMTPATIEAFRDHGQLRASVEADVEGARHVMEMLSRTGISLEAVTDCLLDDGITQFSRAFDTLLAALGKDRRSD